MNDQSLMPWGKHQGEKMGNVPASYLIWLYDNNKCAGEVKKYIEANKETLSKEVAYEKNNGHSILFAQLKPKRQPTPNTKNNF